MGSCSCCVNNNQVDTKGQLTINRKSSLSAVESEKKYFDNIGILQIKVRQQTFYGVGVFEFPHFITLTRYFAEGATLKVFVSNISRTTEKVVLPITDYHNFSQYSVNQKNIRQADLFGDRKIFMKVKLTLIPSITSQMQDIGRPAPLLSDRSLVRNCKGFVIGIPDFQKLEVYTQSFSLDHISKLRLNYSAALIFIQTQGGVCLYGIYDNVIGLCSEDYYLQGNYRPRNNTVLYKNESYTHGSLQRQNVDSATVFPYRSIGLLLYQKDQYISSGTASILWNNKGTYKYLITCAHNFYSCTEDSQGVYLKDYRKNLDSFSFKLPTREILEQPNRYQASKKQQNFKIRTVYMHKGYVDSINNYIRRTGSSEMAKSLDFAIVQLYSSITTPKGFRVSLFQKPFKLQEWKDIEVTGFPKQSSFNTFFQKQYTSSVSGYTGVAGNLIELSNPLQQRSKIKHKLSTLTGNSGSPIYEYGGNQNSVYLFGVHTGGGEDHDSVEKQFLKLSNDRENPTYGKGKLQFHKKNVGAYLYNKIIYSMFLTLPGIHTVTDNYAQLISHIAILELADRPGQYGIGFLTHLNHIAFSSSYNLIKQVIMKRHSGMQKDNNILVFNLQQKDRFRFITNTQFELNNQFGLKGLGLKKIQGLKQFTAKHAPQVADQHQTIAKSAALGLKVGLIVSGQNLLNLVIEPFEAQRIFEPSTSDPPVFYFVYDFKNNILIWETK